MLRLIAFANAIAITTAGLALFLMALRVLVPQFFVFFFNAQFFGANVASLLPAEPHPLPFGAGREVPEPPRWGLVDRVHLGRALQPLGEVG